MTPEQVKQVIDALDVADIKLHQALGELHDKLIDIERERRERILRIVSPVQPSDGGESA